MSFIRPLYSTFSRGKKRVALGVFFNRKKRKRKLTFRCKLLAKISTALETSSVSNVRAFFPDPLFWDLLQHLHFFRTGTFLREEEGLHFFTSRNSFFILFSIPRLTDPLWRRRRREKTFFSRRISQLNSLVFPPAKKKLFCGSAPHTLRPSGGLRRIKIWAIPRPRTEGDNLEYFSFLRPRLATLISGWLRETQSACWRLPNLSSTCAKKKIRKKEKIGSRERGK